MLDRYQVVASDGTVWFDADTVDYEWKSRNRARATPLSRHAVAKALAKQESGPDGTFSAAKAS